MSLRVGGRYRYSLCGCVMSACFIIISFDGTRYTGRSDDWTEAIWFFSSDGIQIGTDHSPDSGCASVSLILEDENIENSSRKSIS